MNGKLKSLKNTVKIFIFKGKDAFKNRKLVLACFILSDIRVYSISLGLAKKMYNHVEKIWEMQFESIFSGNL